MTRTFVSVTVPVFVTTIVQVAVPPLATVCSFGFFVIAIAGVPGLPPPPEVTDSGSQAPERAG